MVVYVARNQNGPEDTMNEPIAPLKRSPLSLRYPRRPSSLPKWLVAAVAFHGITLALLTL